MTEVDAAAEVAEFRERVRMLAVPESQVFSRRVVIITAAAMFLLLFAILGGVVGITADTNRAVERQVEPLRQRITELDGVVAAKDDRIDELSATIAERDALIADYDAVIGQAVAGIQLQNQMLRDAGVEPPEIVLLPPADPPAEADEDSSGD